MTDIITDERLAALRVWATGGQEYFIEREVLALLARLDKAESGWQDISTAPTLDRVFVAGWQRRSGTCAGYWWFEEDVTDERGVPMGKPDATLWRPLPPAPNLPPPPSSES